jgi:fructose-specific phosphotransferase system component IIB
MKSDTVPVENESEHASAFQQFIDSIRDDLFVNKKAFTMSFLLDKFCSFLPPNIASKYITSNLQQKLLNYFGNAIIVEKQCGQGKSNTVFSSSITVSEAIHAANNINAELKFTELETSFENTQSKQLDEEQTLHDAANILRSSLQSLEMSNEYYPLPSEVSITESCKFIPHCRLNFIVWLVNDSCFYQENNYEGISNDILRKCISIAECVISLHKKTVYTFQRRSCTSVSSRVWFETAN